MDHLKLGLINLGVGALTGNRFEFRQSPSGDLYFAATKDRKVIMPHTRRTGREALLPPPGEEPVGRPPPDQPAGDDQAKGTPAPREEKPSSATKPDAVTPTAPSKKPPRASTGFDFEAAVRRANDGHSTACYRDVLLPRPTAMATYHGIEHTVVSLFCGDWVVANLLVPHLGWFSEGIPTWTNTCFGDVRWRLEYRDGRHIPVSIGGATPSWLPFIPSCKKALKLSKRHRSWVVSQRAGIAEGGPHLAMPPTYTHALSALAIHRVISAKSREPIVEAYMIAGDVQGGKPTVADSIHLATRVVLSYHDAISLASNALVWAVAISRDGSHRIARVLPRGLVPTSTAILHLPPATVAMSCAGLDVVLEDGRQQDLLEAALYSRPRPPRPRKPRTKLYNGIYPVRV